MAVKKVKPTSPGRRFQSYADFGEVTRKKPEKSLLRVIKKTGGKKLLETLSDGPWLLVDLPPGQYEITASCNEQKKVQNIEIRKGLQTVMFHWK